MHVYFNNMVTTPQICYQTVFEQCDIFYVNSVQVYYTQILNGNLAKHMLMFILSYKIWNMKKNYIKAQV